VKKVKKTKNRMATEVATPGQFCWHDVISSNKDNSAKFFKSLLGWEVKEFPEMKYAMLSLKGKGLGGLVELGEDKAGPRVVPYIVVEDVDAHHRDAIAAGGVSIVAPTDVPGHGRMSHIRDPAGAIYAVWKEAPKPKEEEKKSGEPTVSCFICFDDVPASKILVAKCTHNYCKDCWENYLSIKIRDGAVLNIQCPYPGCRRAVDNKEIQARVSPDVFSKFKKFYRTAELSMNPNARFCTTPNCEGIMVGNREQPHLTCNECKLEICFNCNGPWHRGPCDAAAKGYLAVGANMAGFAAYALVTNIKLALSAERLSCVKVVAIT